MTALKVYVVRDGEPRELAACDDDSLGFTLRTLVDERQIRAFDKVGILDRPDGEQTGRWLVSPYAKEW